MAYVPEMSELKLNRISEYRKKIQQAKKYLLENDEEYKQLVKQQNEICNKIRIKIDEFVRTH